MSATDTSVSKGAQLRALLDRHYEARYFDHFPVVFFSYGVPVFIGYAASLRGADRLIEAAGKACIYVSRAKLPDGREFFMGHN